VRRKRYMGYTDKVETSVLQGDSSVLSLLPYRLDKISVDMNEKVTRGEKLSVKICLDSDKPGNAYTNTLSINLYDPSGRYEWIYSENVTTEGNEYYKEYTLPYNEKTGKWKLFVKDVATGVTAEREFEVI
jgi:hypothetical protein